jgi:hypothetical protein
MLLTSVQTVCNISFPFINSSAFHFPFFFYPFTTYLYLLSTHFLFVLLLYTTARSEVDVAEKRADAVQNIANKSSTYLRKSELLQQQVGENMFL